LNTFKELTSSNSQWLLLALSVHWFCSASGQKGALLNPQSCLSFGVSTDEGYSFRQHRPTKARMSILGELKRRNVFRVGIAYALVGWLLMQVTDIFAPALRLPEWIATAVAFLLIIGFPVALFLAWAFELTPEGIQRESDVDPSQSNAPQAARKLDRMIIIGLVAVVAVLLVDRFAGDEPPNPSNELEAASPTSPDTTSPTAAEVEKISLAVLPFVNVSDDEGNEYFSDGISEELLNALVKIESLRVPSRTSSFTFKGSEQTVSEIGQALQVDHVLEGSVRKAGGKVRVTAQLIEVESDTHLWSDTYTRDLTDIFAVQDEIAQAIVEALRLELSVSDQQALARHSTENVEAYSLYLLGQYLFNRRSVDSLYSAIEKFQAAIDLDPGFDLAWAGLADVYLVLPEYEFGSAEQYIPRAREAVQKTLALNPRSARTYAVSGLIRAQYDFDWDGALKDFQTAITIDPSDAAARHWYGDALMPLGRTEEALEQLRLAAIADPLSIVIRHTPGYFYLWTGRFDEAEAVYQSILDLDVPFRWTIQNLDMLYTMRGEFDKAREMVRWLADLEGFDPEPDLARIAAVENPALKPRALGLLAQRQDIVEGVWGKAMQYALMDEYELALDSLEKAFDTESPWRVHMIWVVNYEPLHGHPRFQAMLEKMNLLP
jgi:TolB-like protein